MNVVLVAKDVAPSSAFERLELELTKQSIRSFSFLRGIDRRAEAGNAELSMETWMEHCDVVLLGMSSSEKLAEIEIRAAEEAVKWNIPFGLYADTYGVINRGWLAHLRDKASFVFVINEEEGKKARGLYPNAKVVITGNPMWEDFCTPKLSREEVRQRLGVSDEQKMVLCSGGKNLAVNMLHWGGVIEAFSKKSAPKDYKVFLSVHPGDKPAEEIKKIQKLVAESNLDLDKDVVDQLIDRLVKTAEASYLAHYNDLVRYSKRVPVKVVTKDFMSGPDMLPGADLVIESASTLGIEAAFQRIPVISSFWEVALARIEESCGSRDWELCDSGAALRVDGDPNQLLYFIQDLLLSGSLANGFGMKERQAEAYPMPPEKGAAVRMMAETLIELARK